MVDKVKKSDAEWKTQLTSEQYRVTRKKGTEAPFTGEYWNTDAPGTYRCVCCGTLLFESDTKFDAGCGWPSFYAPATGENLRTADDTVISCAARKSCAPQARTWGTYSTTGRSRRDCAIA
jgi:peptide-methionine (R)-S-oxide reductase